MESKKLFLARAKTQKLEAAHYGAESLSCSSFLLSKAALTPRSFHKPSTASARWRGNWSPSTDTGAAMMASYRGVLLGPIGISINATPSSRTFIDWTVFE